MVEDTAIGAFKIVVYKLRGQQVDAGGDSVWLSLGMFPNAKKKA